MPCNEEIFEKVRDDYVRYQKFFECPKPTSGDIQLALTSCGRMARTDPWLPIGTYEFPFDLYGESVFKSGKYSFKLRTEEFGQSPFFRFDSFGIHLNEEDGRGLKFRKVTAPHFHKVSEDGIMRAYKTPDLELFPEEVISDISLGGKLFFEESKLTFTDGLSITIFRNELPLILDDPLAGATFS